jgi:FlaG/FlaF family flagellin (archaellin)
MQDATNEAPTAAARPSRSSSTSSDPQVSKAYVGELDIAVNEADLLSEFNQVTSQALMSTRQDLMSLKLVIFVLQFNWWTKYR